MGSAGALGAWRSGLGQGVDDRRRRDLGAGEHRLDLRIGRPALDRLPACTRARSVLLRSGARMGMPVPPTSTGPAMRRHRADLLAHRLGVEPLGDARRHRARHARGCARMSWPPMIGSEAPRHSPRRSCRARQTTPASGRAGGVAISSCPRCQRVADIVGGGGADDPAGRYGPTGRASCRWQSPAAVATIAS